MESFLIKTWYCHYCRCNVRSIVCCTSTCHFVYLQGLSVAMRGFRVYVSLGVKKFREYYTYANAVLALDCENLTQLSSYLSCSIFQVKVEIEGGVYKYGAIWNVLGSKGHGFSIHKYAVL